MDAACQIDTEACNYFLSSISPRICNRLIQRFAAACYIIRYSTSTTKIHQPTYRLGYLVSTISFMNNRNTAGHSPLATLTKLYTYCMHLQDFCYFVNPCLWIPIRLCATSEAFNSQSSGHH